MMKPMSTIELTISVDVQEIMYAVDASDAQEIAEYHDLLVVDLDDADDATAHEWAERHGYTKEPIYGVDLDDNQDENALEWAARHGYAPWTRSSRHIHLDDLLERLAFWLPQLVTLVAHDHKRHNTTAPELEYPSQPEGAQESSR
jgi:hypothetical protein